MIALMMMVVLGTQSPDTNVYGPGDVQEVPKLVVAATGNYRSCIVDAGVHGLEGVEFVIDPTGHVEPGSVSVIQSTDPILDSLAVSTVRNEVFNAGRRNGQAVRVRVQQPLRYGTGAPPVVNADSGVFPLSCLDRRPNVVTGSPAVVPPSEVEGRDTGTVRLSFRIDTLGRVDRSSVEVLSKRGPFDRSAAAMIANTVFQPGYLFGRPVVTRAQVAVIFRRGGCSSTQQAPVSGTSSPEALDAIVVQACGE